MLIFCFGDSNTYGFDPRSYIGSRYAKNARWPELLNEATGIPVITDGENGREIPRREIELACAASAFIRLKPDDLPIVMLGTNDLLAGASAQTAGARMEAFLSRIPCRHPVIVAPAMDTGEWTTPEMIAENVRLAAVYRELAERRGLAFVDASGWDIPLCFDGVHFTEAGHRIFSEKLLADLRALKLL